MRPGYCFTFRLIILLAIWSSAPAMPQDSPPDAPSHTRAMQNAKSGFDTGVQHTAKSIASGWPRELDRADEKILMYQPQLEGWEDDQIRAYAALSVVNRKDKRTKYGVVSFTARTDVDKVNRQVTLDNCQITNLQFPAMKEREAEFRDLLQSKLPGKTKVIALDQLESALMASDSVQSTIKGVPVNNNPPEIVFSARPAMLVLIDGPAKFRDVGGTHLGLLLNSQSTVVLDKESNTYYLSV